MSSRASSTVVESGGSRRPLSSHQPGFIILVGVLFLILFIIGLMMQVETNEAFITHGEQVSIYKPNWDILMQIPNLLLGNMSNAAEAQAAIFGWMIELIYLGFVVGYELLQESASRSGQFMGQLFKVLSWAIVLFNAWTDGNYGTLGGGIWGHIGFSVAMSFIVGFFGTIGISLIGAGWKRA